MFNLRYLEEETNYEIEFKKLSKNVVEIIGDFPIQTKGFTLSRLEYEDNWDYSKFTTIYKELDNGAQFSNDESVYVEPEVVKPEIIEPSLEEVQEAKVVEMNNTQQEVIQQGVDVTLTDGTVEHFTLTEHDQTSLMGLQTQVAQGLEQIPWHTSDQGEHCKYYSNADMALITQKALEYVTYHVTYFRDLRIYIRSLETKDEVNAIYYGIDIPEQYQSEVLADMYASMSNA